MEPSASDIQLNIDVVSAQKDIKSKQLAYIRKIDWKRKQVLKKKRFEPKPQKKKIPEKIENKPNPILVKKKHFEPNPVEKKIPEKIENKPNPIVVKKKHFEPNPVEKKIPERIENKPNPIVVKKRDRPKPEEPAFASSILRGEILPKINQAEGKYVFHSLKELGNERVLEQRTVGFHHRKNHSQFVDSFPNVAVKTKAVYNETDTNDDAGGEFASFVKKNRKSSVNPSNTNADVKSTGRFIRKRMGSSGVAVQNKNPKNYKALTDFVKKSESADVVREEKQIVSSDDDSESKESLSHEPVDHLKDKEKQAESEGFDFEVVNHTFGEKRKKTLDDGEDVDEDFRSIKKQKKERWLEKEDKNGPASRGKFTSLFGNNPVIPRVPCRAVKPVHEPVFSNETFADLNIHKFQVTNLEALGLTRLTTVQRKAVPPLLEGRDALVRSQTGSGKTLSYALPLVELLQRQHPPLTRADGIRALVVLPTRELALQTYEWFLKIVKPFMRLVPGCLVGGEKRKSEKARLRKGITILVGTPGRILDHVQHTRAVRLNRVQYFVLDEADCMLDMGYERDIASIVHALETETAPLLSASVLAWNRKTHGVKEESTEGNTSFSADKTKPNKIIFNSDDEDENASSNDGSQADVTGSEEVKNVKQVSTKILVKERESLDGNSSDYDAEVLAGDVIPRKTKIKKTLRRDHSDSSEESEESEDESESEDDSILTTPEAPSTSAPAENNPQLFANFESDEEDAGESATSPKKPGRWQTILLSATLTPAVERLAGLALRSPVFIDAADADTDAVAKANVKAKAETPDLVIPESIMQHYMVVPAKLRLVTLAAFIAWKCKLTDERKILLFCATLDMVNYLTELLTVALGQGHDDDDSDADSDDEDRLKLNIEFFRLHGDMEQKERTHVFQAFRAADCGVLLCTDVAARGLDLPSVDWIVQYNAPGSIADYVHRVGRTARAGAAGNSLIFLLPMEVDFVESLQNRRIRLQEEYMDKCLMKLALASSSETDQQGASKTSEGAATSLQLRFENAVLDRRSLHDLAVKAYVSYVRFYASYPLEVREVFNFKTLHLGHAAKSFALRDPPSTIGGIGRRRFLAATQDQPQKRLNKKLELDLQDIVGRPQASGKRLRGWSQRGKGKKSGFFGKSEHKYTRNLMLSEFASGL